MKCTVKISSIIIFLSLLCSFVPMSFYYISAGWIIIPAIRIVRFAIIVCLTVKLIKERNISRRFLAILLFLLFLFMTTLINGGILTTFIENVSIILIVMLMMDCLIYHNGKCNYDAIKVMYNYFALMMLINFIFMKIQPMGVYRVIYEKTAWNELSYSVHFLNTENRLIEFELPLLVLTLILCTKNKLSKYVTGLSMLLVIVTVIKARSMTSIAGIVVFIAVFLIIRKRNVREKAQFLYPMIFVFQIIFELIMTNTYVMAAISFVFGRVDTIISRFALAEKAKDVIANNWIIGVGGSNSGRLFSEGSIIYWVHNHSLDLIVQSGVLGYFLFIRNFLIKVKNKNQLLSMEKKIVFAATIALLVMGMTESFVYSIELYFILALADI